MLKNGDKSALILEDDVDAEFDLERMWARIERQLPQDWHITYLGHCWGKELLCGSSTLFPPLNVSTRKEVVVLLRDAKTRNLTPNFTLSQFSPFPAHAYGHPLLHPSVAPMCQTAYAMTSLGASHLLSLLLDPWSAYQVPIGPSSPLLPSASSN